MCIGFPDHYVILAYLDPILGWNLIALSRVRSAKSAVMFLSVILATTLRSYRSIMVQLYRLLPFVKNRYIKSVHYF